MTRSGTLMLIFYSFPPMFSMFNGTALPLHSHQHALEHVEVQVISTLATRGGRGGALRTTTTPPTTNTNTSTPNTLLILILLILILIL